MSTFYAEMAALAQELLAEFGGPVLLTRVTPGGYDPATGLTIGETTATWNGVGAKFDYEQRDIDGTKIREGDQRVYMSTVGTVNPQTGDTLTINTKVFNVVKSSQLQPSDTSVLFDVQLRGVA